MTYSLDFRQRVLSIKEKESLTFKETAKRFCLGMTSLVRWTHNINPKRKREKPATKINMENLRKHVEEYPDAYQYERAATLGVSASGIGYALKRLGVTYKKNSQASESGSRKALYFLPNTGRV
jgi:transposase